MSVLSAVASLFVGMFVFLVVFGLGSDWIRLAEE